MNEKYDLKLGFKSSHEFALGYITPGSKIIDLGGGQGLFAQELIKRGCEVVLIDKFPLIEQGNGLRFIDWDLENGVPKLIGIYCDLILLMDVLEHLTNPEKFLAQLGGFTENINASRIIVTVPNVAFITIRLALLFGKFEYGDKGILDKDHKYHFTKKTIVRLIENLIKGKIRVQGIPAPIPLLIRNKRIASLLLKINEFLIYFLPGLFSYQFGIVIET